MAPLAKRPGPPVSRHWAWRLARAAGAAGIAVSVAAWVLLLLLPSLLARELGMRGPEYAVRIDRGVGFQTSDGIQLVADVGPDGSACNVSEGILRRSYTTETTGPSEIEVELWPTMAGLEALQPESPQPWTIRQKQTGVDDVTIGGSLSANVHGRVLTRPPLVGDIESFELVDATAAVRHCSRSETCVTLALSKRIFRRMGTLPNTLPNRT